MAHHQHTDSDALCHTCECEPFVRNAYWTGKLMLARDFLDEQRFLLQKLRHHNQQLHGTGVVCGLKVVQHESKECRDRFVCIEPGVAVDCCGHDIVVCEKECFEFAAHPAIKALKDADDKKPHTMQICIRYRECPTEEIPVLYDECGCDDARCAPNRILESYEFDIILDPPEPEPAPLPNDCADLWLDSLDACPHCDHPDCVVLATIQGFVISNLITDPQGTPPPGTVVIDNITDRHILPSIQAIKAVIDCILESGTGGGQGPQGKQGPEGKEGPPGKQGPAGPGLQKGLTQIAALSWLHNNKTTELLKISKRDAVVIAFTGPVDTTTIDADHVFQVLIDHDSEANKQGLHCWCAIDGDIVPVNVKTSGDMIISATASNSTMSEAVAFLLPNKLPAPIKNALINRGLWVILRCDFVIDKAGRAVDGEYTRAQLKSGDRPSSTDPDGGSEFGIQGGVFESWFRVGEQIKK